MLSNPQFQIASQLLIGLMTQGRSRQLGERIQDVKHALEVSAELIRQWEGNRLPNCDYSPPTPVAPTRTREAMVDRDFIATDEWRRKRATQGACGPASKKHGPTVH